MNNLTGINKQYSAQHVHQYSTQQRNGNMNRGNEQLSVNQIPSLAGQKLNKETLEVLNQIHSMGKISSEVDLSTTKTDSEIEKAGSLKEYGSEYSQSIDLNYEENDFASVSSENSNNDENYINDDNQIEQSDYVNDDNQIEQSLEIRKEAAKDYFEWYFNEVHTLDFELSRSGKILRNLKFVTDDKDEHCKCYKFPGGWVLINSGNIFIFNKDIQEEEFHLFEEVNVSWLDNRVSPELVQFPLGMKLEKFSANLNTSKDHLPTEHVLVPVLNNHELIHDQILKDNFSSAISIPIFLFSSQSSDYLSSMITLLNMSQFDLSEKLSIIFPSSFLVTKKSNLVTVTSNGDALVQFINEIRSLFFNFYDGSVSETQDKFEKNIEFKVIEGSKVVTLKKYKKNLMDLALVNEHNSSSMIFNYLIDKMNAVTMRQKLHLKAHFNNEKVGAEQARQFKTEHWKALESYNQSKIKEQDISKLKQAKEKLSNWKLSLISLLIKARYEHLKTASDVAQRQEQANEIILNEKKKLNALVRHQHELWKKQADMEPGAKDITDQQNKLKQAEQNYKNFEIIEQSKIDSINSRIQELKEKYNKVILGTCVNSVALNNRVVGKKATILDRNFQLIFEDLNEKCAGAESTGVVLFNQKASEFRKFIIFIFYLVVIIPGQNKRENLIQEFKRTLNQKGHILR